ncbi:MAG: hypothetical protein ACOYMU_08765 [Phycisphaerales bacterium]
MTDPLPQHAPSDFCLDSASARSISAAILAASLMPVDFAVEELRHTQFVDRWMREAFHEIVTAILPLPVLEIDRIDEVLAGRVAVSDLNRLRQRSTVVYGSTSTVESRNRALVIYALAVAAGLRHHKQLLTSQSRAAVDLMLAELSSVVPEPYASHFELATHCEVLAALDANEDGQQV